MLSLIPNLVFASGNSLERLGSIDDLYVVAIGNNTGHKDETTLRYAEDDASEFATVMRQLGGSRAENTILVQGEGVSSVRRILLETNQRIRSAARTPGKSTALIVYYSGHADARGLHLGEGDLSYSEFKALVTSSPATIRILVLDSCRSGGVTRVKGLIPSSAFDISVQNKMVAEGVAIITSSTANEDSHESDRLGGSFFSHHLTSGLRGAADLNRDGHVTLNEVYSYAYQQTLRSSGKTRSLQHPTYEYDIKGKGDFILTRITSSSKQSARFEISQAGKYLIIADNEHGSVVGEVAIKSNGTELVLPPGSYFVQKRATDHYFEYDVKLVAGKKTILDPGSGRRVSYARLVRKGGSPLGLSQGVYLLGGARGELLSGFGATPQISLGYTIDFSELSVGVRLRYNSGQLQFKDEDSGLSGHHVEVGGAFVVQRFADLPIVSIGLGFLLEATNYRQNFSTVGDAPSRSGWGFVFGGLLSFEKEITNGLLLRFEGGPLAHFLKQSSISGGAVSGADVETPVTWWVATGLGWRFW